MFQANTKQEFVPSRIVSIKPINDIDYTLRKRTDLQFYVPPEHGFIDTRQLRLKYNIKMTSGRGCYIPDPRAGQHSLWRGVRHLDGSGSVELENVDEYNSFVASTYHYSENDSIQNMRSMFEGVSKNGIVNNLYHDATDWTTVLQTTMFTPKTVQIYSPLNTGLLNSGKTLMNIITQGSRLTLTMEDMQRSIMLPDLTGVEFENGVDLKVQLNTGGMNKTVTSDVFNVDLDTESRECNFDIGDVVYANVAGGGTEEELGVITAMTKDGTTFLRLKIQPNRANATGLTNTYPVNSKVYIKQTDRFNGKTLTYVEPEYITLAASKVDFTLSNIELVFTEVEPPQNYVKALLKKVQSSEGLTIPIQTSMLQRYNLEAITGITQQSIPANCSKAYCVLSVPLDSSIQSDMTRSSFKSVLDGALEYQYVWGSSVLPNRPIELSRLSSQRVEPLALHEAEKSLMSSGIPPRNLQRQDETFWFSRAFAINGSVSDVSAQDLSLRVNYSNPTKQKLFNHFLVHQREINISSQGISVTW